MPFKRNVRLGIPNALYNASEERRHRAELEKQLDDLRKEVDVMKRLLDADSLKSVMKYLSASGGRGHQEDNWYLD